MQSSNANINFVRHEIAVIKCFQHTFLLQIYPKFTYNYEYPNITSKYKMSHHITNISLSKRMDFFEGVRIYDNLEVIGKTSCCECSIIDEKDFLVTHGEFNFLSS